MNMKRLKRSVAYLLVFALLIGVIPNSLFKPITVYAAQTIVFEEDFNDIGNWGTSFTSPGALSLSPNDPGETGIKENKIVTAINAGGVQFLNEGKMGLLNTSKVAPGFDVQLPITTGQALQISMDWEENKNPNPANNQAAVPRESTLRVWYSFDNVNYDDLTGQKAPRAVAANSGDEVAQKGVLDLVIPEEEVQGEKLYLRIFSKEEKIGGGNRPGFILDNLKIISTDDPIIPEEDKVAPKLVSKIPGDNATNVPINQWVKVTFDEFIVVDTSVIALRTGDQDVAITSTVDDAVLTIKPSSALVYDTTYQVTIPVGAVKDKSGNIYNEEIKWSFTTEEEATTISIAEARAKTKGEVVQVQGTVIAIDGSNFFIQDETAGIVARGNGKLKVGNIIQVKGPRDTYNGLEQISSSNFNDVTITVMSDIINPLPEPKLLTISELKDEHQSQRVKLEAVTIGKIDPAGNTPLVDGMGNETIIRKVPKLTGIEEGDLVDVVGALGKFNTFQLFVASQRDVTVNTTPDTTPPVITHEAMTTADIFNDLCISASVKDNRKVVEVKLYYKIQDATSYTNVTMQKDEKGNYVAVVPKEHLDIKGMYYYIEATDGTNIVTYPGNKEEPIAITVTNEDKKAPEITKLFPRENQIVVNNVMPLIGAEYRDDTGVDVDKVKLIVDDKDVTAEATREDTKVTYEPKEALAYGTHKAKIQLVDTTELANTVEKEWTFTVSNSDYQLYFGQLHAHTAENSDGAGTLLEAYDWAKNRAQLDFFAVTDHSNSFDQANADDKAGIYNLGDYNKNNVKWQNGQRAAADSVNDEFVGIYGYEMTWSGGPGHMNTFNTEGFVSRNNKELNAKANDAGLRAYYNLLKDTPNSISQFNHPGETFGTFSGFAYYDPIIDERISLIEVGNGEGAVGSGGYFRSYNEFNQALDKGWHLAPTNNQDNHKKEWGTANTARTVIYSPELSVDGLYNSLNERRVYATEDNNLEIIYTLNEEVLGTIIDTVPQEAVVKAIINDPDSTDKIATVAIISNGGKEIYKETYAESSVVLEHTLANPAPGYYYIKVVQEDGHIAVTAPIWLGKAAAVGIADVKVDTFMPVTDEELTLTTELFNNEDTSVNLRTIRYDKKNGSNIANVTLNTPIESSTTYKHQQVYIPTKAGKETIIITAEIEMNGIIKTYTSEIELDVRDQEKLVYIGIDASHFNEYVSGNYKDSMGNFGKLAAEYNTRTVELRTSEELLEALDNPKYQMMVFTAPSRRDGSTGRVPYANYSDEEIAAVAKFAATGKTVIVAGWGDFYESYSNVKDEGLENHMAGQQNKLLQTMGASLRISDDGALDDVNNGGQSPRLYLTDYNNYVSPLTKGIVEGQVYSNYGGSSVHAVNSDGTPATILPDSVLPIISGHSTTYSKDQDGDGYGFVDKEISIPKYNDKVLLTATETLTHANGVTSQVVVSGAAFMSNFEIQATIENAGTLNYSNYNILENIIATLNPVEILSIAEAKLAPEGIEVTIEGIATSSVYTGADDNKGFFDCIYVEDETGGINLFPVSEGVEAGQRISVTGRLSAYQGETQLAVSKVKVIDEAIRPVSPTVVSTKEAMAKENTGKLIQTTGKVTHIVKDDKGVVGQFTVNDGTGPAIAYINGYITKDTSLDFVKLGSKITVTGLASIGENFQSTTDFLPRIRIRDRGEIVFVEGPSDGGGSSGGGSSSWPIQDGRIISAQERINQLTSAEKETIKKQAKENIPYTSLTNTLTMEQLNVLTNGKFTKMQLEELLKRPELLAQLGIDLENNMVTIVLPNGEDKVYNDLQEKHWAYESVQRLTALGIVQGTPEGNFNPEANLQISDAFTFLDRILLLNGVTAIKLPRSTVEKYVTDKDHWAFAHVASVASKLSEETLKSIMAREEQPISREVFAQLIFEITDGKLEKVNPAKDFKDTVDSPYKEALMYCVETGLLYGMSEDEMAPQNELTRAQIMAVLERLDAQLGE